MFIKQMKELSFMLIIMTIVFGITVLSGSGVAAIGIMLILFILCVFTQGYFSIEYFIICTVFQNIVLITFAPYVNSRETLTIIIMKEIVVYSICIIYFLKYRLIKFSLQDFTAIGFGIIAAINILRAPSLRLSIVALRQITVIVTCYYFGKGTTQKNSKAIKKMLESIVFWGSLVCILGFILYFCTDQFWLRIGFEEYWGNKTSGEKSYNFVNFYTYDLGFRMKRLVSIFAEPLSCAHFLGIGFVTLFVVHVKASNYIILKIIYIIALIMGLTKASIFLIASVVLIVNYSKIKSRKVKRIFAFLCALVALLGMVVLNDYASGLSKATSIGNHFNAFLHGVTNISLLGSGLGTTGYNANIMGLTDYDRGFDESFFSLCSAQLGLLGTLFLYSFIVLGILQNLNIYQKTGNKYVLVSIILLFEVMSESLFSASSVSMLGTGLYFALAGMCSNLSDKCNGEKANESLIREDYCHE